MTKSRGKSTHLNSRLAASLESADIGRAPLISTGGAGWYPPSGGLGALINCSTVEVHLLLANGSTYLYAGDVHSPKENLEKLKQTSNEYDRQFIWKVEHV